MGILIPALTAPAQPATHGGDGSGLRYWDLRPGAFIRQYGLPDPLYPNLRVKNLALMPDSRSFLSLSQDNGTLTLRDLETGEIIRQMVYGNAWIWGMEATPDGNRALIGTDDGKALLYDLTTGDLIREFVHIPDPQPQTSYTSDVDFSPDGRTILSASGDGTLILWDVETGAILHRFAGHTREVRGAAFSPDGTLAVSGASDGTMILSVWRQARPSAGMNGRTAAGF